MDEKSISSSPGTNELEEVSVYMRLQAQESNTLYTISGKAVDKSKIIILSYEDMVLHPENITPKVRDVLGIDDFWLDPSKVCVPASRKIQNRDFRTLFLLSALVSVPILNSK